MVLWNKSFPGRSIDRIVQQISQLMTKILPVKLRVLAQYMYVLTLKQITVESSFAINLLTLLLE